MPKPLKIISANDTFGALVAFGEMLASNQAIFVTPITRDGASESASKLPSSYGLPDQVDDELGLIVETSGSTGSPKRIELPLSALVASAKASQERLGGPGQWLLTLPINHIAGANVLIRSLYAETQPVLMNTSMPFTVDAFSRAASLMTGDRKYASLVPTQLVRLLDAVAFGDDYTLGLLKRFDAILVGGAALLPELANKAAELGINLIQTYGMTETCGGCVYDGEPLNGVEVDIYRGVLRISGATLASNIETEDGWFSTNDIGDLTDEDKWIVIGRADRVIKSGGIKISLDRVEQLASNVAGVLELVAAPIDDREWGQRVGIVYVGSPEVADDIARALANDLGPAGKPVRVLRTDKIAKLPSGKIDYQTAARLFEIG
jgi:O-succinylbenzoic acid--CoA ligase